jgi:hypothetical protein
MIAPSTYDTNAWIKAFFLMIEQWRGGIRQLRLAETHQLARNEENRSNGLPEEPDMREADPVNHEWFTDSAAGPFGRGIRAR